MDEDSNAESSNNSTKRRRLNNLPTVAADETDEEISDLSNANDVEMIDILSPSVEKRDEPQGEEPKLKEPKNNKNSEDQKKDNCGRAGDSGATGDSAEDKESSKNVEYFGTNSCSKSRMHNDYAESDKKDEEAAELSDKNDPDISSRITNPNRRHNRTRALSSVMSSDIDSDDTDDLPTDITSKSSSSSSSESEIIPGTEDSFSDEWVSNFSNSSNRSEDNASPDFLYTMQNPNYNWNQYQEIMYREHRLSGQNRSSLTKANAIAFQNRYYGARHVIEKMKLLHSPQKLELWVNSLHFNRAGNLIVSGSNDYKIILLNWSANKIAYAFNGGHNSHITDTKFIELSAGINIVSSGDDGQVRHATIPPSGAEATSRVLLKHSRSVNKIALDINNPYEILTACEDGHVKRCDLRQKTFEVVVTVKLNKRKVPLLDIVHHPLDQEFCVSGGDLFIRVYDKRNRKEPVQMMCLQHLKNRNILISSANYNSTGSEILATYEDEDIYLFDNKCYRSGHFSHRYISSDNDRSDFKVANFFGPNSEYVVGANGSGNMFFWDKGTQSIINRFKGYNRCVVWCIEPHPSLPILATAGNCNGKGFKIWMPLRD